MAYPKPNVKWIPSPNYGYPNKENGYISTGRYGQKIIAIIDHIAAGTKAGVDSWFQNPDAGASAHFMVCKDGSIHQYVDETNCAWANGRINKPTWTMLNEKQGINPNYYTISIEHEGYPQDGLTDAQYKATVELHKYLIDAYNIPVDRKYITGHFAIDGVDRPYCPGPNFPWTKLMNELTEWRNSEKVIETFVDGTLAEVTVDVLNVRSGPGENYTILGQVKKSERYKLIARTEHWNKIEIAQFGTTWVYREYTIQIDPVKPVPVVEPKTYTAIDSFNKFTVDGQPTELTQPVIIAGYNYIAVKDLAKFGFKVGYDAASKTVIITSNQIGIKSINEVEIASLEDHEGEDFMPIFDLQKGDE